MSTTYAGVLAGSSRVTGAENVNGASIGGNSNVSTLFVSRIGISNGGGGTGCSKDDVMGVSTSGSTSTGAGTIVAGSSILRCRRISIQMSSPPRAATTVN